MLNADQDVEYIRLASCPCPCRPVIEKSLRVFLTAGQNDFSAGKHLRKGFVMRLSWLFGATVGLLVVGASAFAQNTTINYVFSGTPVTFNVTYKLQNGSPTPVTERVYAGPFTATIAGHDPFTVYCVDLENNTANPSQVQIQAVNVGDPARTGTYYDNLRMAAWLFNEYNPLVAGDAIKGAALQAAIWDVIDGGTDYNVNTGNFYITNDGSLSATSFASIANTANAYLSALSTAHPNVADGVLYKVDHTAPGFALPNGQDMLGGSGSFNPNASPVTPEGSSLLLLLPGLIPVAVGLRRRRMKTPVGE